MTKIPFEKQVLPVNPVEQIGHKIAQGMPVSGVELRDAIEWSVGHQLDDRLREVISKFSVSEVKRRGRPPNNRAREDFALKEVDEKYPARLQKFEEDDEKRRLSAAAEGTVLPSAERTPRELAYTEIQQEMSADFPNMSWEALANKHSAWRRGHFHPRENDTDSEDYEAEIERLFPSRSRNHNYSGDFE